MNQTNSRTAYTMKPPPVHTNPETISKFYIVNPTHKKTESTISGENFSCISLEVSPSSMELFWNFSFRLVFTLNFIKSPQVGFMTRQFYLWDQNLGQTSLQTSSNVLSGRDHINQKTMRLKL